MGGRGLPLLAPPHGGLRSETPRVQPFRHGETPSFPVAPSGSSPLLENSMFPKWAGEDSHCSPRHMAGCALKPLGFSPSATGKHPVSPSPLLVRVLSLRTRCFPNGRERTRTSKALRPLPPQGSASANFATRPY